jgi:hypothetical protein
VHLVSMGGRGHGGVRFRMRISLVLLLLLRLLAAVVESCWRRREEEGGGGGSSLFCDSTRGQFETDLFLLKIAPNRFQVHLPHRPSKFNLELRNFKVQKPSPVQKV